MPESATSRNGSNEAVRAPRSLRRRTLLQGAAWSLPAIAIATAAPSMAASMPHNALSGVFNVQRTGNSRVTWDGRTSQGGSLYVTDTAVGQKISGVSIRFGSTKQVTNWTKLGTGTCWTLPVADGTYVYEGETFYMYRSDNTCISPQNPVSAVDGDTPLDSDFYWRGDVANPTALITQRIVTVTQPPSNTLPGTTIPWIRNRTTI